MISIIHDSIPIGLTWSSDDRPRRTPGFASIAILVMALGICANISLFAIVRSVLLNPLPYSDPDRLVRLYEQVSAGNITSPDVLTAGRHSTATLRKAGETSGPFRRRP